MNVRDETAFADIAETIGVEGVLEALSSHCRAASRYAAIGEVDTWRVRWEKIDDLINELSELEKVGDG